MRGFCKAPSSFIIIVQSDREFSKGHKHWLSVKSKVKSEALSLQVNTLREAGNLFCWLIPIPRMSSLRSYCVLSVAVFSMVHLHCNDGIRAL